MRIWGVIGLVVLLVDIALRSVATYYANQAAQGYPTFHTMLVTSDIAEVFDWLAVAYFGIFMTYIVFIRKLSHGRTNTG